MLEKELMVERLLVEKFRGAEELKFKRKSNVLTNITVKLPETEDLLTRSS